MVEQPAYIYFDDFWWNDPEMKLDVSWNEIQKWHKSCKIFSNILCRLLYNNTSVRKQLGSKLNQMISSFTYNDTSLLFQNYSHSFFLLVVAVLWFNQLFSSILKYILNFVFLATGFHIFFWSFLSVLCLKKHHYFLTLHTLSS